MIVHTANCTISPDQFHKRNRIRIPFAKNSFCKFKFITKRSKINRVEK